MHRLIANMSLEFSAVSENQTIYSLDLPYDRTEVCTIAIGFL